MGVINKERLDAAVDLLFSLISYEQREIMSQEKKDLLKDFIRTIIEELLSETYEKEYKDKPSQITFPESALTRITFEKEIDPYKIITAEPEKKKIIPNLHPSGQTELLSFEEIIKKSMARGIIDFLDEKTKEHISAILLHRIANALSIQGDYQEALFYYDQAIQLLSDDNKKELENKNNELERKS